jgi:hypothetical protein
MMLNVQRKQKTKKSTTRNQFEEKEKKSQIDALDRFDQQFQNIRKEQKNTHLSLQISKGCLPKKNPRTYHSYPSPYCTVWGLSF